MKKFRVVDGLEVNIKEFCYVIKDYALNKKYVDSLDNDSLAEYIDNVVRVYRAKELEMLELEVESHNAKKNN